MWQSRRASWRCPPLHLQSQEPSPELFERLAIDSAAEGSPEPEGFYPRSKSISPVQRKIKEMEVGAAEGAQHSALVGGRRAPFPAGWLGSQLE